MAGYRPQNRGNKSASRVGPGVTRRLKAAGINVSPAAAKYSREGIFVSARGFWVSVYIDLPAEAEETAQTIAGIVTSWGLTPAIRKTVHGDGGLTATVTFDYPEQTRESQS